MENYLNCIGISQLHFDDKQDSISTYWYSMHKLQNTIRSNIAITVYNCARLILHIYFCDALGKEDMKTC